MWRHHLGEVIWLALLFGLVGLSFGVMRSAAAEVPRYPTGTPSILIHPWDRTFTCDPAPSPGMALAPPPGGYHDGRFFGADAAPCAGYVEPGSPRGPLQPGLSLTPDR